MGWPVTHSLFTFRFASEHPVKPLEPGEGSRQRSADVMDPVDLGADPRQLPEHMRGKTRDEQSTGRSKSPLHVRQKVKFLA